VELCVDQNRLDIGADNPHQNILILYLSDLQELKIHFNTTC